MRFEVIGYGKILSFLCFKERVGQCDAFDPFHARILTELRINVEEDRHIHLTK